MSKYYWIKDTNLMESFFDWKKDGNQRKIMLLTGLPPKITRKNNFKEVEELAWELRTLKIKNSLQTSSRSYIFLSCSCLSISFKRWTAFS